MSLISNPVLHLIKSPCFLYSDDIGTFLKQKQYFLAGGASENGCQHNIFSRSTCMSNVFHKENTRGCEKEAEIKTEPFACWDEVLNNTLAEVAAAQINCYISMTKTLFFPGTRGGGELSSTHSAFFHPPACGLSSNKFLLPLT